MTGYGLVNLKDMVQELGEERTKEILSEFSCPMNKDVEFFLHCKAIEFAKQGIAQTQLVFTSYKDAPEKFNALLRGRKRLTSDDVVPICKALGITPNELFGIDHCADQPGKSA